MAMDSFCSAPLGSCCMGIPITVHYTFFLLLAAQVFFAVTQYDSFWYTLLMAILYGPILLVTIIIHELGHAWMNKRFGTCVGLSFGLRILLRIKIEMMDTL